MKLQTGMFYRDGRSAGVDDANRLLDEFTSLAADSCGEFIKGPLIMAYRGDHVTWEEEMETQPCIAHAFTLTFDGRLDNRDELAVRLGLQALATVTDPMLIAEAYRRFGDSIFPDLIGEFAMVLWNKDTQSIIFIRSTCGTRPLYYRDDDRMLVWSSDFAHLVRVTSAAVTPDENYAVEYLVSQPSPDHSPLSSIHVVPPNTALTFAGGKLSSTLSLWNPERIKPVRYHTDAEYEEHCRHELASAVMVRLRAKLPVFAELSGGFDSSSIVLLADRHLRSTCQSPQMLKTVSCIFKESVTCDESPFIRSVEDTRGIATLPVREQDQDVTLGLRDIRFIGTPTPFQCFPGRYKRYGHYMGQSRVLMTGEGGDHLFWSIQDGAPVIAERLRAGDLPGAHRECQDWSRLSGATYFDLLFRRAVPLALASLYPPFSQYQPPLPPRWLGQRYRTNFKDHVWDARPLPYHVPPGLLAGIRQIKGLFAQLSAGFVAGYRDIHVTQPFAHRPLIDFCLGLPISQFLRSGQTRSLMRRALSNLLPLKILRRQSKGSVEEIFYRALDREWPDIGDVHSWRLCELGMVDPRILLGDLEKTRLGLLCETGNLLRVFSLERWMRSLAQAHRKRAIADRVVTGA